MTLNAVQTLGVALLLIATTLIVMALLARGFVPAPGPTRQITDRKPLTSS